MWFRCCSACMWIRSQSIWKIRICSSCWLVLANWGAPAEDNDDDSIIIIHIIMIIVIFIIIVNFCVSMELCWLAIHKHTHTLLSWCSKHHQSNQNEWQHINDVPIYLYIIIIIINIWIFRRNIYFYVDYIFMRLRNQWNSLSKICNRFRDEVFSLSLSLFLPSSLPPLIPFLTHSILQKFPFCRRRHTSCHGNINTMLLYVIHIYDIMIQFVE